MPTDETEVLAHRNWEIELSGKGWDSVGIELENGKLMTAIFQDLGILDDLKRQTQLRAYIIKKQQANGELDLVRFVYC